MKEQERSKRYSILGSAAFRFSGDHSDPNGSDPDQPGVDSTG